MQNTTRTIIALIGSFLISLVGMLRILSESFTSPPLFVAYIFAITGLIGIIANSIMLRKANKQEENRSV